MENSAEADPIALRKTDLFYRYYLAVNDARLLDAREAIRAAMLINGGAATAVLGFAASLISRGEKAISAHLAISLGAFTLGVACAAIAALMAYVSNYRAAERAVEKILKDEMPTPSDPRPIPWRRWIAVVAVGMSITLFVVGALSAVAVLLNW